MKIHCRYLFVLVLAAVFAAAGTGLVGASDVINHMGSWDAHDPNEAIEGKVIEEVTGFTVNYTMLPVENANEVLSLRVSSPGAYDSLKLNVAQYNILTGQGALIPLDDLLEEHGQRILEIIRHETWKAARVDGKI